MALCVNSGTQASTKPAKQWKNEGAAFAGRKQFDEAARCYSDAISLDLRKWAESELPGGM